jgi:uncharacterized membrane protein
MDQFSPRRRNNEGVEEMETRRTIEELTRRNVAVIAEMEQAAAQVLTRGDRVAERLAAWVGSWTFLISQSIILLAWMALNPAAD